MAYSEIERQVSIYALSDETGIRYIGKAVFPHKRYAAHILDSKTKKTPVYVWIRSLLKRNIKPVMSILSVVSETQWEDEERRLIAHYRSVLGGRLLNLADGGDQPYNSPEARVRSGDRIRDYNINGPTWKGSADDLVIWVYNRMAALMINDTEFTHKIKDKMRARYLENKDTFACWANV